MTNKKELQSEIDRLNDDYQHTHDTMWRIFQLLCDEFGMTLTMRPKSLLEQDEQA